MGAFDKYYAALPVWAQHCAISVYGYYWKQLRFGSGFSQFVEAYQIREKFSREEWKIWQKKQLQDLLKTASENVPFYQKNWTQAQKEAARQGTLEKLPLLDKECIRILPDDFVRADLKPKKELVFYTSGSTGTPIKSIWTVPELRDSLALREVRSANWAGVSFKMPRATFSGRLVEPDPNSKGPFYRWNVSEKQVYFSAFHLKPDTAQAYVRALEKHKIEWGTGYAQSFYLLAKYILMQKISKPTLKAIVTTSEKLTPEMRAVMEEAYQCRVYEEYSTVENALFVSECEKGSLHVSPDVGVIEILRPDGEPCESDEIGEVVTTCLMHGYQLLIRYRLGDMAAWSKDDCPCGRHMPVLKEVMGRLEDVVTGPDGRQLVRFHGIFIDLPHVIEGQVIQDELDKFQLKLVVTDGFGYDEEKKITNRFQERLGNIQLKIEKVEKIERTERGKFKAVICNLKKRKEP